MESLQTCLIVLEFIHYASTKMGATGDKEWVFLIRAQEVAADLLIADFSLFCTQVTLESLNWWMTTGQGKSWWSSTADWTSAVSSVPDTMLELVNSKRGLLDFFHLVRYVCGSRLLVLINASVCIDFRLRLNGSYMLKCYSMFAISSKAARHPTMLF